MVRVCFVTSEVISVLVAFRETKIVVLKRKNYSARSLYTSSGVIPNSVPGLY